MIRSVALLLMLSLSTTTLAAAPLRAPDYDPGRTYAPLIDSILPGVVVLQTQTREDGIVKKGKGTGFFVQESGLILTNLHVIDHADSIEAELSDGRHLNARVIGTDRTLDLALLQLPEGRYPYLQLHSQHSVRIGDRVLTLGNPYSYGISASAGIVSGVGRALDQDRWYGSDDFIQTDAAINPGNSGGPMLNLDGEVIGMNTLVLRGANSVGFAIPSHLLLRVLPELREFGSVQRGYLGIRTSDLKPEATKRAKLDGGVLIREVIDHSPAAGRLKPGDLILSVETKTIHSGKELLRAIGNLKPGEKVNILLIRGEKEQKVRVRLGTTPAPKAPTK